MKKYLFIISLTGMLFTACSSADDLTEASHELTPEEKAAIIAEANMDSEVQIRLGFGSQSSSVTRAPLESDENDLFETPTGVNAKYLGLYCLAQQPQSAVSTPGPVATANIDWHTTDATTLFYLMERNQPARVVKKTTGDEIGTYTLGTDENASDVQFLAANLSDQVTYFYPYGNWYNYYFYGYYPRQTTGITETANKITVDFTIDGSQDIIHGTAKPTGEDAATGYNAKHMRKYQNADGVNDLSTLPQMALKHKLAQLRFWVKCSSKAYEAHQYGQNGKEFKIQDLTLKTVPNQWTLDVADRATPANEGGLTRKGTTTADIAIKVMDATAAGVVNSSSDDNTFDGTNSIAIPYIPSTSSDTPTLLGYAMIPTTAMLTGQTITGREDPTVPYFTFTIYAGTTASHQTWTPTEQAISVPEGGFVAGKVYNVILNLPPPEEIDMTATLDQWGTVDVTTNSVQNINMTVE